MRKFVRASFDLEAANRAIKVGSIGKIFEGFAKEFQPEGMWLVSQDGNRCTVAVFDLPSTSKIPPLAEPFFMGLGGAIEATPVMDLAHQQTCLSAL